MKKFYVLALSVFCVLTLGSCGENKAAKSGKVTLKFSNVSLDPGIMAGDKFKEIAEAADPSLEIVLYPKNVLGDDRVVVESTRIGDIDIVASSTSPLASTYPDFFLFDAPYLFLGPEDADTVLGGPVGQKILDDLSSIGLKGLVWWENGFRNLTASKKAMKLPADVRGMKLRTMDNEVHLAAWKALGANPTPMAFSELFTALQQGTIDGQENPFTGIAAAKLQEVQKYMTTTEHVYTPFVVMMNLKKFDSLTDKQKAAIMKASQETFVYEREVSRKMEKSLKEEFKNKGIAITDLTQDEKKQWQDMVMKSDVYKLVKAKMQHPEYLDEIVNRAKK